MKKLFTLVAGVMFAADAFAGVTPFKNLYTVAEVYPAGAGEIYLAPKNDDQAKYVYDMSEDYGEYVYIMETIGENGSQDQYANNSGYEIDASGTLGNYEEKLFIEPAEGYEFVCVTKTLQATGIYYPDICYQRHTGNGTGEFEFFWDYDMTEGNLINVNSASREQDGDSNDPGQDGVFAMENWSENPDTYLYVVFRKVGDELPIFDKEYTNTEMGDVNGDGVVNEDDATAIADYRVGKADINVKYADVNGDGEVNIADAVKLINNIKK